MNKIKVYTPDNALQNGYFFIIREIFAELKNNKWLILQLFKRDLLSVYKQSMLGVLWAFIFPLVSVGTFIILNRSGIFTIGETGIPYSVFAITGMAFWQLFATGITSASGSLVKAGSMIVKINFSKKSLVIASLGQSVISFLVQIILLVILFVYFGLTPEWKIIFLPLFAVPIILFAMGFGFIFSILNGIVRDIGNIIAILMTFFMFLTPVLYPKPETGLLAKISEFNPMYYMVSYPRDIILTGQSDIFNGFYISALLSVFIFFICIFIFHLTESRVSERI
ncbi:MAG: ABC transporter permease [Acidobacteriota bacterium]